MVAAQIIDGAAYRHAPATHYQDRKTGTEEKIASEKLSSCR
jgi:hypothetical protein